MGSLQIGRTRHSNRLTKFLAVVSLLAATVAQGYSAEAWRQRVAPEAVGPVPLVKPFTGEFRFGWSDLEAARAKAKFSYDGDKVRVEVEGGTTGLARNLWKLDAKHSAVFYKDGLRSISFSQLEKYAKKTVSTQAVWKPEGVWRQRDVTPDPNGPAKWKRIKIQPIRDIVAAMMFIRSQPLNNGDKVGVMAFPGDTPYLAEVSVAGREEIKIAGKTQKAIKLDFLVNTIVKTADKKEYKLEPHKKFKNGTVWLSDDENRIPLRAEVNIFIGYVFGELAEIKFSPE